MRITKLGELPKNPAYEGRCEKCKTEVECLEWDLHIIRPNDESPFSTVACSICGNDITLYLRSEGRLK